MTGLALGGNKSRKLDYLMADALKKLAEEDPTFRARHDQESGQTIISGMGELHLDIYIERMKREYGATVESGMPQVAYRETISRSAEFDYLHKKVILWHLTHLLPPISRIFFCSY